MILKQIAMQDGTEITCRILGSGKPMAIMPPGWGCGGELYAKSLASLGRDRLLIIPDPRGSGTSIEEKADKINVKQHAMDIWAICDALGFDKIDLAGHSNGGWAAILAVMDKPKRVEKLLLLNAEVEANAAIEMAQSASISAMIQDKERSLGAQAIVEASEGGFKEIQTDLEFTQYFRDILPCYAHDPVKLVMAIEGMNLPLFSVKALKSTLKHDPSHPVRERLSKVQANTLCITGASDFLGLKWNAKAFAEGIPTCHQFEVSHAGHYPWIEQPDISFAAMRAHLHEKPAAWT